MKDGKLVIEILHDALGDHLETRVSGSANMVLGMVARTEFELAKLKACVFADLEKVAATEQ